MTVSEASMRARLCVAVNNANSRIAVDKNIAQVRSDRIIVKVLARANDPANIEIGKPFGMQFNFCILRHLQLSTQ